MKRVCFDLNSLLFPDSHPPKSILDSSGEAVKMFEPNEKADQPKSSNRRILVKASLFVLSCLSSYLIYQYLSLSEVDRLLLFNFEKNPKWKSYIEKFRNQSSEDCDPDRSGKGCECFKHQISRDLAIWKDAKLNGELLSNTKKLAVHYQIIDNKLYRQKSCPFTPRCKGVEHFLLKALEQRTFKNIDLLINVHDWPQIHSNYKRPLFPVFSFSKDVELFKGRFTLLRFPRKSFA